MRTQCVALVTCLNIGVDPPDVVKPSPCARMECWIDTEAMIPAKALKAIGARLLLQYERWHEKARYKSLLDPTAEELRKTLINLRRVANEERVMMHYNGHGVPKPTANGEIWVYNKSSTDPTGPPTQYIPVSLYDLQTWMGGISAPSIYVFDCSNAGIIVDAFQHFLNQRREKMLLKMKGGQYPAGGKSSSTSGASTNTNSPSISASSGGADDATLPSSDSVPILDPLPSAASQLLSTLHDPTRHILLAACGANETLPLAFPELPADLFTACLTTPIKMALRWFVNRSLFKTQSLSSGPSSTHSSHFGGHVHDFASTSTGVGAGAGANSGPSSASASNRQRLYDLIDNLPGIRKPNNRKSPFGELNWIFTAITDSIAWNILPREVFQKLFRQDLLVSSLFRNFLLAQRIFVTYNCRVVSVPELPPAHQHPLWSCWDLACDIALSQGERFAKHGTPFTPSTFFEDQLTAFEIWLDSPTNDAFGQRAGSTNRPPPMQLPIVLQVLLSTDHRLRALQLLARFMDYGTWAINLALSVGIFPYVLKLLQSPSKELREVLVFIWAKIFALDRGVSADLSKVEYGSYFIHHLLKYQGPSSATVSGSGIGAGIGGGGVGGVSASVPSSTQLGTRPLHSRNSSVTPSPLIRPMHASLTSTPATTPFITGLSHSGGNSGTTTPHIAGEAPPVQQYPSMGGFGRGVSNPPPLDLPPSNIDGVSITSSSGVGHGGTGASSSDRTGTGFPPPPSASHLAAGHVHMRALPLHDPAARHHNSNNNLASPSSQHSTTILATAAEESPASNTTHHAEEQSQSQSQSQTHSHSQLPPQPQPSPGLSARIPFPLDLTATSNVSPLQSPSHMTLHSAKPSPMLGGIAFSPTSPMLSPQLKGATSRFEDPTGIANMAKRATIETPHDAHDLTRMAKETMATTNLQHLLSLFIIACLAHANPKGQQILMQSGLNSLKELTAPHLLFSSDVRLRQWSCFAIGKCWHGFGHAKTVGCSEGVPETIVHVLMDPVAEVRAAALWALGAFFGGKILPPPNTSTNSPSHATGSGGGVSGASMASGTGPNSTLSPSQSARAHLVKQQARLELELHLGATMSSLIHDGSPLVRRELMLSLAELVYFQQDLFLSIATAHPRTRESISVEGWIIWRAILRGCRDCSTQVQEASLAIKGYLKGRAILNQSQLGRMIGSQQHPGLSLAHRHELQASHHETIQEDEFDASQDAAGGADGTRHARTPADRLQSTHDLSPTRNGHHTSPAARAASERAHTQQSIAHIDADDTSMADDSLIGDYHDRDAALPPTHSSQSRPPTGPPIRHFTRFKMGHLRPGGSGVGGGSGGPGSALPHAAGGVPTGGQRRSAEKSSLVKTMEASTPEVESAGTTSPSVTLDERSNDAMWTVPKSRIFDEAYASFHEPLLVPRVDHAAPTPSMAQLRQVKWRHARHQAMLHHARELRHAHPMKASYVEVAYLNAEWESTSCVMFHPYENMLIAADNHATIGVFNYSEEERGRERLNIFSNDNPPGTKITQLESINDANISLLMVGSDDGVVRIWRHAHEEGRQQLVTAWAANPMPEVMYANKRTTIDVPTLAPAMQHHEPSSITPSQSYQDAVMISGSSFTPQARLLSSRLSVGLGLGGSTSTTVYGSVAPSSGMRHSASTPALSSVTPNSRSGSLLATPGSMLPPSVPSSMAHQRSPNTKTNISPTLSSSSSGAINIPSHSLGASSSAINTSPPYGSSYSASPVWSHNNNSTSTPTSRRKQRPPLILEWQQSRGRLIASGNGLEVVRLWDVRQEQCINEIPIFGAESLEPHLPSYVTSMTSNGGDLAWIGCYDGTIRHFDLRLSPLER